MKREIFRFAAFFLSEFNFQNLNCKLSLNKSERNNSHSKIMDCFYFQ